MHPEAGFGFGFGQWISRLVSNVVETLVTFDLCGGIVKRQPLLVPLIIFNGVFS
jgi:hypothetical protein